MKLQEKWEPLNTFLQKAGVTKQQMYEYVRNRQWYDGYIIKKSPTGRWKLGNYEDFCKWMGII